MTTRLPSRRFREVQLLIGLVIVMVLAAVAVELRGVLQLADAVEAEGRRAATAAAPAAAAALAVGAPGGALASAPAGVGVALVEGAQVRASAGRAGPAEPAWWPWRSQLEWEAHDRAPAGPLELEGERVAVAYEPLPGGRAVRAVVELPASAVVSRWRGLATAMALAVAGGGGLLAWLLVARVLAPYRELLAEAGRVSAPPAGAAEDRFLIETFHETIARLERSEVALRARADELAVLSDVLTREASSGVVITDSDGEVRAANEVAQELIGGSLAAGRPLPPAIAGAAGRAELAGRAVEVRRFPLRSASGEPQGEVTFLSDRTPVEALERAMREREGMAALGELAAGMAHELRNALATIRGYLRLLAAAGEEQRARYVTAIEGEAETLSQVLDRFLSFAEPRELRRERVELRVLAEEVVRRAAGAFPGVAISAGGEPVAAAGDHLALGLALDNLVRNAAEALEGRGGLVEVRVERAAAAARVVVDDDGPGVSAEVRPRLFAPFASTKPSGGLGLAVARRLARLHGGDVALEERPGPGARFVLTVPLEGAR